jgi:hypothetical protein
VADKSDVSLNRVIKNNPVIGQIIDEIITGRNSDKAELLSLFLNAEDNEDPKKILKYYLAKNIR